MVVRRFFSVTLRVAICAWNILGMPESERNNLVTLNLKHQNRSFGLCYLWPDDVLVS